MGPIRAVFLTFLGAALAGVFVWLLTTGGAGVDPNFAIGGALFFGACALLGASNIFAAKIPAADADGSISIPNSAARCIAAAIACGAAGIAIVLFMPALQDAENPIVRYLPWIAIPGCAFGVFAYLRRLFTGEPAFRLDAEGVTINGGGAPKRVPWREVTNVHVITVRGSKFLSLSVTKEFAGTLGGFSKFNSALGFGNISLAPTATGVRLEALETLVLSYLHAAASRPGAPISRRA